MGVRTGNPPWHNEPVEDSPIDRTSLENIELAIDESAPIDSPEFTGVPTVTTPGPSNQNDNTIANTSWVQSLLGGGSSVASEIITDAAYKALDPPEASTLYLITEAEGAVGGFRAQGELQYPKTYAAIPGGTWLVDYGTNQIIRRFSPSFSQFYSLGSISIDPKSVAYVPGSSLIILTGRDTGGTPSVFFWSTSSLSVVATTPITDSGSTLPLYGAGALASDGFVYFPPYRSVTGGAITGFLKVNPSTHTVVTDNFSGTYVNQAWGYACTSGDGKVYFLPGFMTAFGGSTWSGTKWAYMDPGTHVLTVVNNLGIVPPFSSTSFTTADAIAANAGVYTLGNNGQSIFKFSAAGGMVMLQDLSLLDPFINCYSGFATAPGNKVIALANSADDFTQMSAPALVRISKTDDSVAVLKMPEAQVNQVPFNPCSTICDSFGNISAYLISPTVSGSDVPPGYPDKFSAVLVGDHFKMALGAKPLRGAI